MSVLDTFRKWFGRKRAPPLNTAGFTIAIAPPAPGAAVDLRPYTAQEIRVFCKAACPAGFEIVEYPEPGDAARVILHMRGEPASHKHTMYITRTRAAGRK